MDMVLFHTNSSFFLSLEDFTVHDRSRESESIIEINWYSFEDNAIDKG